MKLYEYESPSTFYALSIGIGSRGGVHPVYIKRGRIFLEPLVDRQDNKTLYVFS